jgi:hypothetical protein
VIVDFAHELFHDIDDLHTKENVRTILTRFVANKEKLERFEPLRLAG